MSMMDCFSLSTVEEQVSRGVCSKRGKHRPLKSTAMIQ